MDFPSKVPLADGTVLWVSREGHAKLQEEGVLDTEGAKLQQALEDKIAEVQRRFERKLAGELRAKQQELQDVHGRDEQDVRTKEAELAELRSAQQLERSEHAEELEKMRMHIAQFHR
eukprot:COSAG06_NODE_41571_length_390_cov_0.525773_1_plen_116_part_10